MRYQTALTSSLGPPCGLYQFLLHTEYTAMYSFSPNGCFNPPSALRLPPPPFPPTPIDATHGINRHVRQSNAAKSVDHLAIYVATIIMLYSMLANC